MKYSFLDDVAVAQMLHDDPFEERGRDAGIPDALRIYDDDRSAVAHAEARGLTAFHAPWPEQETFTLQQRRKQLIQLTPTVIGRTEAADADQYVVRVGIHSRIEGRRRHERNLVSSSACHRSFSRGA
jgi:hypothetical protein